MGKRNKSLIVLDSDEEDHDLLSAENLVRSACVGLDSAIKNPINVFEYNLTKSMVLLHTSKNIAKIWPEIHKSMKMESPDKKSDIFAELLDAIESMMKTGSATYLVFTEQSIVSAVSATENYFRDKLSTLIKNNMGIAKRFSDKELKVSIDDLFGIDFNVKDELGSLLVSRYNFQKIDELKFAYQKALGERFINKLFTSENEDTIRMIFEVRHLIVHKAGIIDQRFIDKTQIKP